jgi:hypothetical protein
MGSQKIQFDEDDMKWFDAFYESNEFAEALAIVWGHGSHLLDSFVVRTVNRQAVERFHSLVHKARPVHSYLCTDKKKPYTQWKCSLHHQHPFVLKIQTMGWTPIQHNDKPYPVGQFDEKTFIKTYTQLHHSLDTSRSKEIEYIRPRLRFHGTQGVLERITVYLSESIGVKKKKVQNHHRTDKTKILQYTSKKEIPHILEYIGATASLEKYHSLQLGYEKTIKINK